MEMVQERSFERRSYPSTRRAAREMKLDQARTHLRGYLTSVRTALLEAGFSVPTLDIAAGSELEATLTVVDQRPRAHRARSDHDPAADVATPTVELAWAEDIGWSVSHYLLSSTPTPWRYLHRDLVPAPATVVEFLRGVIDAGASATHEVGMVYPAQFRYRSQSTQPVIDALARHSGHVHVAEH